MEISNFRELIGMEDSSFHFSSFDEQVNSFGDDKQDHILSQAHAGVFDYYKSVMEPSPRPTKQMKTSSWNSSITTDQHGNLLQPKEEMTVSSKINYGFTPHFQYGHQLNNGFDKVYHADVGVARNTKRDSPAQDHILAERKRREKLSQRFIALSALVPGLKKLDKASVLGDAIKHMKTLQEKVKTLEDQAKKRPNTESVVFVKRFEVLGDNGESSSSNDAPLHEQLPEIEARFLDNEVLIRIHCEKKAGALEKTLVEIEKLHLSILNSTTLTFVNYALDITVIARMDKEFAMTTKDLMKNLRSALKQIV